jgi:hypothetical protein
MSCEFDLSIIIINWNSVDFLRKCLASVYAGTLGLKFQTIVVDNASFDGCGELLGREFPGVIFIQSQENLGFAGANNLGFAHSKGRNILFLNPDTEVIGPALEVMCLFLDSRGEAGAVGGKLLNSDLSIQTSCIQRFPSILNQSLDFDFLRDLFPKSALWGTRPLFTNPATPVPVEVISGACLMAKRTVLEKVGGFSSDYFMYAEDVDLCYEIQQQGWKCYYVPQASVVHHCGRSSNSKPEKSFSAIMMRESTLKFMRKTKGKLYASAYRSSTALVAAFRLLALSAVFLLTAGRLRRNSIKAALAKWVSILRWAVGLEVWVKELERKPHERADSVMVSPSPVTLSEAKNLRGSSQAAKITAETLRPPKGAADSG